MTASIGSGITLLVSSLAGRTLIKFIVTGGSAALMFAVLAFGSRSLGYPPFLSSVVSYSVAFAFAYTVQRRWTFKAQHDHKHTLPRYLIAQILCGLLSGVLSDVVIRVWGFSPLAMAVTAATGTGTASFALSRFWVFRTVAATAH